MAEVDYKVNYDDERFQTVEADEAAAMDEVNKTYDGMIDSTDGFYQKQIDAANEWEQKQTELQNQNTAFTIEKIEQDKAQAQKDYTKEQSAAYADWQKQSNKYGVQAEQQAAAGLYGTGYSESSQVAVYNAYQNRVASARESFQKAVLNYDNSIKEARLQNNSILAEIAYQTLQTTLQLGLEGFQYKNQLLTDKMNQKIALDQTYWNREQDILNQINTENALAESVRQYEKTFAEEQRQYDQNYQLQIKEFNEQVRQYEQSYKLQVKEYEEGIRQFNEEIAELKKQNAAENAHKIKQLELEKEQLAESKRQADLDYKIKQEQLAEEKRQYDKTYALEKAKSGTVKSSSGSSSGSAIKSSAITKQSNGTVTTNKDNTGEKTINYASWAALGYGPSSAERMNELIKSGEVIEYEKDGVIYFKKGNKNTTKTNNTASAYIPNLPNGTRGLIN